MRQTRDDVRSADAFGRAVASTCPRRTRRAAGATTVVVGVLVALAIVLELSPLVAIAVAFVGFAGVALIGHRVIGSLLAGLALLLARPYNPGEHVRLYAPALRGVVVAEIVRLGLVHTTLATSSGLLVVPNSVLVRAAPPEGDLRG